MWTRAELTSYCAVNYWVYVTAQRRRDMNTPVLRLPAVTVTESFRPGGDDMRQSRVYVVVLKHISLV